MRTQLLRGTEDTTVLLVYPSSADEYRLALRTLGGSSPEAGDPAPEPAGCRPARAAYVVTAATQRHLWQLPDLAVSGRCAVAGEARALELLQEAARRPGVAAGLFSYSPAGARSKRPAGPSGESSIAAVRRVLIRGGADVDRAVRSTLDAAGLPAAAREALSERLAGALDAGADRAEIEIGGAELVLGLPWSVSDPQWFDRDHVARALDGTHSALVGVKEGILQFLASCPESRDLLTFEGPCSPGCARTPARPALVVRPKPAGPRASALCLAGPLGIGKSSLATAVARALGRACVSASLGGSLIGRLIRGDMSRGPGRIVEGIREAGVCNPVFILKDIDGLDDDEDDVDPVLSVLDASRRTDFRDEYLAAVPFDLSGVLWVTTATDAGAIPGRVRDRMTVLEFQSYTEREKLEIAQRHLLTRPFDCAASSRADGVLALDSPVAPLGSAGGSPSSSVPLVVEDVSVSSAEELKALCLRPPSPEGGAGAAWRTAASRGDVRFAPEAILRIIRDYTSESGVGQLHSRLAEVCRQRTLASGLPAVITSADVPALLGGGGSADALPLVVRDAIKAERARLAADSTGKLQSTNSWIEWLEHLPWNRRNDAPIDLARTREVLDAAQAGLGDAKDRIIEYLAVRKRNPCGAGAALCFLGPPGVGKTSLAQAVARALGRAFVKLPCGGLHDETDLRGHNRSYYKAQPGLILRELRRVGYRDPVFVLDELDKIGPDPAAVLLEVLDPEQNGRYRDAFVEIEYDLGEVTFIATANDWHRIAPPLRDRLEVVELPGYTEAEKLAIARSHLVPAENRAAGLVPAPAEITDGALREIVRRHTREPGIRQFNRCIKAVCRKVALGRETGDPALDRRCVTVREVRRWLGSGDGDDDGLGSLSRRLAARGVPSSVSLKGRQVFERLSVSDWTSTDPEHVRSREYLECLADLPWNLHAVSKLDLARVRATLDESHAGLADVKERLVDHVAVHVLNPDLPSPVLCLTGPEGVGKTSLACAFAAALGRPCAWVECGELLDAAAFLGEPGHGPGRVVRELRRVGARNPVIVLDELDRLSDKGGLPAAFLELFDAGARRRFQDRYLGDLPFDLSGAVLVATAVGLDRVPSMLRERMAVVDLPGYTPEEKKVIAARHLLPAAAGLYGLAAGDVELTDDAVFAIVRGYAPEPGLWSLLDAVRTVCRKVARRRAEGDGSKAVITPESAAAMLGTPTFIEMDVADRMGRPGVAVALGWTAYGGDVMFVEAGRMPGVGGLTLTGSLDDELKESILTALSWLRANVRRYRLDDAVFRQTDLHVHVQSLADSRRGGSAGVAVAAALASSFTGRPVRGDVALTGEITLSGHVLPVAGIKEKVLGAVRRGLTRVVLPRRNVPHFVESVPDDVRRRITLHAVSRVDEALKLVLAPASSAVDVAERGEPVAHRGPVAEDLVRSGVR